MVVCTISLVFTPFLKYANGKGNNAYTIDLQKLIKTVKLVSLKSLVKIVRKNILVDDH